MKYGPRRLRIGVRPVRRGDRHMAQAFVSLGGEDLLRLEEYSPDRARAKMTEVLSELWVAMGGQKASTERVGSAYRDQPRKGRLLDMLDADSLAGELGVGSTSTNVLYTALMRCVQRGSTEHETLVFIVRTLNEAYESQFREFERHMIYCNRAARIRATFGEEGP